MSAALTESTDTTLPRLLSEDRADLSTYGPLAYRGAPHLLIETIEQSGLTGRGGAAFPTSRKLLAVAAAGRMGVVVANGSESEPASAKDKTLLWMAPHLVLDGLQLAAEAVGAKEGIVYLHRSAKVRGRVEAAIAERRRTKRDRVPVRVVDAPPRFLSGEESAVVQRLDGGAARPKYKVPRILEKGVGGSPTLVQNVETFAHLALIGEYGPGWFRAVGTDDEPGTMLTTCRRSDGAVEVIEVPIGLKLSRLLRLTEHPAQAVLVGGYHGAWLPRAAAAKVTMSNADLRPLGAALGAGVVVALPRGRCGVAESARVLRYLAAESAGQCGPCLNGLPRIANAWGAVAAGKAEPGVLDNLHRWAGLVIGRGACKHPDGSVRFLRSALTTFADEVDLHLAGECSATDHTPWLPVPEGGPSNEQDWR